MYAITPCRRSTSRRLSPEARLRGGGRVPALLGRGTRPRRVRPPDRARSRGIFLRSSGCEAGILPRDPLNRLRLDDQHARIGACRQQHPRHVDLQVQAIGMRGDAVEASNVQPEDLLAGVGRETTRAGGRAHASWRSARRRPGGEQQTDKRKSLNFIKCLCPEGLSGV